MGKVGASPSEGCDMSVAIPRCIVCYKECDLGASDWFALRIKNRDLCIHTPGCHIALLMALAGYEGLASEDWGERLKKGERWHL